MLPVLGSSSLPVTGALASPTDLRVPQPKTLSGKLPSAQAASFANQQLGGLLTGTSSVVGGAAASPVSRGGLPSLGGQQGTTGTQVGDSIRASNANLMQIAQARHQALVRAAQKTGSVAAPAASGGSGGQQAAIPSSGGGTTLSRVRPLITGGYQITDTYRDPEYNREVGGVPNSYHLDKANPAVDIGGSTASLDKLYATLKAMGGWRQLLWRVPGHYDHIHVA